MIKNLNLFLMLIFVSSFSSFANEVKNSIKLNQHKYNQKKSVSYNEKRFLSNLSYDCKKNGYDRKVDDISPREILSTYPKELAFLYLKKNVKELCYYSFSTLLKYLYQDFKQQTENIITTVVNDCIKDEKSYDLCSEIYKGSTLFDLTILLGNYCSKETLNAFKQVNCHFQKVAKKKCSLYTDLNRNNEACPYYFTNKREIKELHKSYFGNHCKKLRWRKPKCMDN